MELAKNPEIAQRFPDLRPALDARAAVVEANRCLNCFDAPCMGACPTHIDVPGFIRRIASGNGTASARTILDANVLGASCARVCPVDVLCEGACVLHGKHQKPIEIGRLQRFAMETFYQAGGRLALRQRPELTQRIACIGAGPASLACAAELRQQGFQVRVIDRRPLPGGLNTYGVAEYKLRAADSLREVEMVRGLGVEFEVRDLNAASLMELERDVDAIFLGVGLGAMHRLDLAGADSASGIGAAAGIIADAGIIDALQFIAAYKSGTPLRIGRRVVVIGAGNTAIDAACAAKRLGADTVTIVYRRQRQNIPAFDFEYDHALREGVEFQWATLPTAIAFSNNALALTCVTVIQDANGILTPQSGSEFTIVCDAVIPAIGQSPLLDLLTQVRGVIIERGRVLIDRATGQTANPKYFAGGDCVNGGREVVDAVADGKRAAHGIAAWLTAQPPAHTEVPRG
jgi:dihydropyrimidine dehydrogenase (NAD+) subunit PreT